MKLLIASKNKGKIKDYEKICNSLGIETTNLNEICINENIEENGKDEEENAIIKAIACHKATGLPVLANDSGLIIEKFSLENQPKQFVRRFKGKELTDEELLNLYSKKLDEVGGESLGHFIVALAIIDENGLLTSKVFNLERHFLNPPSSTIRKGLPLSSLSYSMELKKYESELSNEEYEIFDEKFINEEKEFIKSVLCK